VEKDEQQIRRGTLAEIVESFSIMNAFEEMGASRCKAEDDRELDVLEGFKFLSFVLLQLTGTAFFLMTGPVQNVWKLLDLFSQFIFSCVVGASAAMECFITISAFLGAYKCM
jgi:hypothetical protein